MEQGERFAVACLGFVLLHDVPFRAHFLRCICDWKTPDTAKDFEVLVELDGCGDLALESEKNGVVFVLECKIGAELRAKQTPGSKSFDVSGGYGWGIRRRYPDSAPKPLVPTYIPLTQKPLPKPYTGKPDLKCFGKHWQSLTEGWSRTDFSDLVKDLFSTLAEQRIHCFAAWNMKTHDLKLTKHYYQACQISELLENTATLVKDQFKLNAAKGDDHGLETAKDSYIGRALVCKKALPKWLDFTGQKKSRNNEHLAWFGYAWGVVHVGFYCKDGAAKDAIMVLRKIKKPREQVCAKDEEGYVWINTRENQTAGDQEWIISVFKRLNERIHC